MALRTLEASTEIKAPIERVYAYVADFPRHIEWNARPEAMKALTEGPAAVGSIYATRESMPENMAFREKLMFKLMMPRMMKKAGSDGLTHAEITALDESRLVAWKAHMPSKNKGDLMRISWDLELEPTDSGTRITQRCTIDPPAGSPFAKMVNDGMVKNTREGCEANLATLKAMMESRAGVG